MKFSKPTRHRRTICKCSTVESIALLQPLQTHIRRNVNTHFLKDIMHLHSSLDLEHLSKNCLSENKKGLRDNI